MTYGRNTSGYKPVQQPVETISSRHEAACFRYLQYVFHGMSPTGESGRPRGRCSKYSPTWVLKAETVH